MKGVHTVKSNRALSNFGMSALVLSVSALLAGQTLAAETTVATENSNVFAQVGDITITQRDYAAAYASAARTRFYHGKPNETDLAKFQREISDKLVNEALLVIEAKRRKLKPDAELVKQKLQQQEDRNAGNPRWPQIREQVLPKMTRQIEEENLREQLEQVVRKIKAPSEKKIREYYAANPKLFTEPEQVRVSVILLKVDPSSTIETWNAARGFGKDIIRQIREGASFAEMAGKFSDDKESSGQGGDMGYLHGGMLAPVAEQEVKKLKPGEISDVVTMMEGVAIFQLTERKEANLSGFDKVKGRASELWVQAESDRVWKGLLEQLRKKTPIKVDDSRFVPLENTPASNAGTPSATVK